MKNNYKLKESIERKSSLILIKNCLHVSLILTSPLTCEGPLYRYYMYTKNHFVFIHTKLLLFSKHYQCKFWDNHWSVVQKGHG